ncbi:MAG: protein-disulfide reductase DsbD family protein [Panacagrimonas sp.]
MPWLLLFALSLGLVTSAFAAPVRTDQVEAELIAENQSFSADEDNWVALRLRPDPGWHVYWQNPGDSGIPTQLRWQLPEGVTAGPLHWTYPHRESLGELTNYGYSGETLFLVSVRIRATSAPVVSLAATAKWLVCKDICIPGEAELSLQVPVRKARPVPDIAWSQMFGTARARLPRALPDASARFAVSDADFSLAVAGAPIPQGAEVEFFPLANDLVGHAAPQRVTIDPSGNLRLSQQRSAYFVQAPETVTGVLVVHEGAAANAFQISAQPGEVAVVPSVPGPRESGREASVPGPEAGDDGSLLVMLAFAFVGGIILNLMPCVFPVLAMKALSVMHARTEAASENRRHAVAYTLGVIAAFVTVAGVLIGLRAAGAALGWGFQLQFPAFVFGLAALIFAMGLSLSGVAHFGSSWMGAGQGLAARSGLSGSFFTGVLAVVVASPCTAPFMAPAVGFALAQSPVAALLIFVALGLGLAAPFLLLGCVPRLAAFLPRPGAWMETFKQVMAFPMYLTAVWLLWVLGGLTDRDGMALALVGLVLVALAVWLFGRAQGRGGRVLALAAVIPAALLALHPALGVKPFRSASTVAQTAAGWEPYSDQRFDQLRAEGRSVFVDFTADWCLTCKVNERGVLRSDRVRGAFREKNVALLVGDWTRSDPAITAVLQRYGRSGVPLYLVSRAGAEPSILPQVLTPDLVSGAFR